MPVFLRIDSCNQGGVIMRRIVADNSDNLEWWEDETKIWAVDSIEQLATTINLDPYTILGELVEEEPKKK